jgi:hypothetical protein
LGGLGGNGWGDLAAAAGPFFEQKKKKMKTHH